MKTLLNRIYKPLAFTVSLGLLAATPLSAHAQGAAGNESGGGYEKSMGDKGSTSINPATKKKFIAAFSDVADIQKKYSRKMQNVNDESKAKQLQQKAQSEMVNAIENNDMSIKQYNQIVSQMRNDPELRKEVQQQAQM